MSYSFIGNGKYNSAITGSYSVVINGYKNSALAGEAFIGNGFYHTASGYYSTILNGYSNTASSNRSFIGNGRNNQATTNYDATVLNGYSNRATGYGATVINGQINLASGFQSFVGNGRLNSATTNPYTTVLNGINNLSSGKASSILAGTGHTVSGRNSAIIGGADINGTENDMVYMPAITIVSGGSITQQYNTTYQVIKDVYYYQTTSSGAVFIPLQSMSTNSVCYIKVIGTAKKTGLAPSVLGGSSEGTIKRGLAGNSSIVGSIIANINTDGTDLDFYVSASGTSAGILLSADTGTFNWLFNYELIYY